MTKFNLELFKTLILKFEYIHSNRRKLGMFILLLKCQFVYPNKVNSALIRQFPSFQFLVTWHVTWPKLNVKAQENLKNYFWGRIHLVLGLLARDITNHSYAPNTSLTQALNSLSLDVAAFQLLYLQDW